MPPKKPKEYIITEKDTGHVIHEGVDRRSILPNQGDYKTQMSVALATALITAIIVFIGYSGDNAYRGLLASIAELKQSNDAALQKIWEKVNANSTAGQNQFNWVLQQCCQNAKTSPPVLTED